MFDAKEAMMEKIKAQDRKANEWRERMKRFAASGQAVKAFCLGEGISESMFYRWRQRLSPAETPSAAGFIQVGAAPNATASEVKSASWELRLELGGGLVLHLARH